jgi:hypothetical protein
MSDSGFTTEEADEFAEEDCITQSLEPNDFALRKLATTKKVKYFVGMIQEIGSDGYNTRFMRKLLTFCLPDIETTVVEDPTEVVLKLQHPLFSGSGRRTVTVIFDIDWSCYDVNLE